MNTKLKNNILLIGSSFLLLLQSWRTVEAFYKFHFLLTWKIVLYVYIALFLCGLGYYIRFFYVNDSHGLSENKKEKKTIITFLVIALSAGIGFELADFVSAYYSVYSGGSLLKLQINYGIFTYPFFLICFLFFSFNPSENRLHCVYDTSFLPCLLFDKKWRLDFYFTFIKGFVALVVDLHDRLEYIMPSACDVGTLEDHHPKRTV